MKKIKIIGIGIATMDIYCHMNRMYPGGNEYNIAYNAKLQGADSGFMGVFAIILRQFPPVFLLP